MLKGYLAAIIVWSMRSQPHTNAIMGVVDRFNAISEGLATAPERCAPIFERTDDGTVLAGACSGS